MQITTFAVDLAKSKFQVQGYERGGERQLAKTLTRAKVLGFFRDREERCRVVMEACASAHYWARELLALGYQVELLPAQHVARYRIGNKHDPNDADAIFEASRRDRLARVAVKSEAQQDVLCLHRVRTRLVRERTALANQARGLLAERGRVFPKGLKPIKRALPALLEEETLTGALRALLGDLYDEWCVLEARIERLEGQITRVYREEAACQLIGAVEGIGEITATAVVATVGDARAFSSGRCFAAWLGLTPREHSSGQRRQLGGITKRGDAYLRTLLIHGARAVVRVCGGKNDRRSRWLQGLIARRGVNRAVVALANKNARILWALLSSGECYRAPQPA